MQRVISLKPISATSVSPQKQKRIRAERFCAFALSRPNLKLCFDLSPTQNFESSVDEENMVIYVFDNLR